MKKPAGGREDQEKEDGMTIRAVDPFEALNRTISGGIVLLGVMLLSLPVIALGMGLLGVERWIARRGKLRLL